MKTSFVRCHSWLMLNGNVCLLGTVGGYKQFENEGNGHTFDFLTRNNLEGESLLDRVVTEDKTWLHHRTPPTK